MSSMRKAMSYIIATILMVLLTIALVGTGWMFISGTFSGKTQGLDLIEFRYGDAMVRNLGTVAIDNQTIKVFVEDAKSLFKLDRDTIDPGTVGTITILEAYKYSGKNNVRITGSGFGLKFLGDFGENWPLGQSSWLEGLGNSSV